VQYLVLRNLIPNCIDIYHFPEVTKEDAKKLEACDGKSVNSDTWLEEDWLQSFLETAHPLKHPIRLPGSPWDLRIIKTGFLS